MGVSLQAEGHPPAPLTNDHVVCAANWLALLQIKSASDLGVAARVAGEPKSAPKGHQCHVRSLRISSALASCTACT